MVLRGTATSIKARTKIEDHAARNVLLFGLADADARAIVAAGANANWRFVIEHERAGIGPFLTGPKGRDTAAIILGDDAATSDLTLELANQYPHLSIVLLTADERGAVPVKALRTGATDYLIKPISRDGLLHALRRARSDDPSARALQPFSEKLPLNVHFRTMIGSVPAFRSAVAKGALAAKGQHNILIEGEAGTGKDMLARAVHRASPLAREPFKHVNVRAIPANTLHSVLFGHEKGAFPGAFAPRMGAFEECNGGTLLLSEVNRLPRDVQSGLAEVMRAGRVTRYGARYGFRVKVRVLSISNRPLQAMVDEEQFDADLYAALSQVRIAMPPLRERRGDIPALSRHFLRRMNERLGVPDLGITDGALSVLCAFDWPNNVRQLQAVLFRAAISCNGAVLSVENFPHLASVAKEGANRSHHEANAHGGIDLYDDAGEMRTLDQIEADIIKLAISHYRGKMSDVARQLGIGRSTLYRKLATFDDGDAS